MIEEHLHCAECLKPIATTVKIAGGKTKPAELHTGKQYIAAPAPGGLQFVERIVPLCAECDELVRKASEKAASTRLLIAQPGALRQA